MEKTMPIQKLLDLSTGHMTLADSKILDDYMNRNPLDSSLTIYPYEYGYMVSTSSLADEPANHEPESRLKSEGFSDAFLAVMQHGLASECAMVRFDIDGEYEPDFPIFDWENEAIEPSSTNALK
jgi:hypothetical protein